MNTKIFTVHHGHDAQLATMKKYFSPIQVGCAHADFDLGILRDDQSGALSPKNKYFCELTAMDEMANSIAKEKYVGLMHYRRVFSPPAPMHYAIQSLRFHKRVARNHFRVEKKCITELHLARGIHTRAALDCVLSDLARYLDVHSGHFDIIAPIAVRLGSQNIREQYAELHHVAHYDLFLERLGHLHPKLRSYIRNQEQQRRAYFFNMFVMRSDLFLEYWSILKQTLLSIEKEVNAERLEGYQSRVFGFLAERYMNIFIDYAISDRQARIRELPVAMCNLPHPT
jgi:hypothetical protein